MKQRTKKAKICHIILTVCRVALALTFIFSGFVKAVDPWGMAIKMGEYFVAFGLDEWFYGWRYGLAIWINGAEMMMGMMLLFSIRLRLISVFAAASMTFFTILTFILAIWNPVEDCGCFGEAIKMTNWGTFIKNLILLPMSLAVLWSARKKPMMPTLRDFGFMCLFGSIAFGIGVYSYRHLPLIDFLPYKIGTNLVEAMKEPAAKEVETILVYKDKQTGKLREFDLTDTEWYDDSRWEYVDTKTVALNISVHASVRDFAVFDNDRVITDEIVGDPGVVYLVCASDIEDIRPRCRHKLEIAVAQALERGYRVLCVTAEPLEEYPELVLGESVIDTYNMDATTIKTMLRAKVGVMVLKGGVIVDKVNCRDMLEKGELPRY